MAFSEREPDEMHKLGSAGRTLPRPIRWSALSTIVFVTVAFGAHRRIGFSTNPPFVVLNRNFMTTRRSKGSVRASARSNSAK